ncbi:MAG TPA: hypothetical protein VEA61_12745 [Allosphingosinicella sp.]|nr:hypothetical protein [Allosphingosinicella sp.]
MAQERDRDLRIKIRLAQPFSGRSPLQDFFAAPEFWQCTYDSSWSDCSTRCAKDAADLRAECAKKTDAAEREKCYSEAAERVAHCVKNCPVQMSPTSPPECAGGIL